MTGRDLVRRRTVDEQRFSFEDLYAQVAEFQFGGVGYLASSTGVQTTYGKQTAEPIANDFIGYVRGAYKTNGVIFACILARMMLFSEVRFQYQQVIPRPGDLFGARELQILERPWPGATTGDLLARMETSVSLAGNAYVYRDRAKNRLKVLRPDWVNILVGSMNPDPQAPVDPNELGSELLGYVYAPPTSEPVLLDPDEVAHFAPIPDPEAQYRGMSWITPVIQEVRADRQATMHKLSFFEHGATPNMVIKYPVGASEEQVREIAKVIEENHSSARNAYKTLHLGAGADPMVVGSDFKQLDFKVTQGAGETRIAAASGIPAIIVGLSEGINAATYSNFGQARRLTGDKWLRPTWRQVAGSLAQIIDVPGDARLWYDAGDVSFLQEDEADEADIQSKRAQTIRNLVDAGFEPETAVAAVQSGDMTLLAHSGLYSVQLQKPGATTPDPITEP